MRTSFRCAGYTAAALLAMLCGCSRPPQNDAAPVAGVQRDPNYQPPRDDLGREVPLPAAPKRIVVIGPGATETIFALGEGARIVGRDQISTYPEAARAVPIVGDYNGPMAEKVVAAHPDLIIVQGETYDKARVEAWQKQCGAPVAALAPHSVQEVAQGMTKIAGWLGVRSKGDDLTKPLLARVANPPRAAIKKSAFFEVSRSPLWTAGRGTLIDDAMRLAGLTNVAAVQGYKQYNLETLTARQPDFYVVSPEKGPDRLKALDELRRQPVLGGLKCVRQGRVLVIPADLIARPGPRLAAGIAALEQGAKAMNKQQAG